MYGNKKSASKNSSIFNILICGASKMSSAGDYSYGTDDVKEDPQHHRKDGSLTKKEKKEGLRNLEKTSTKESKQHSRFALTESVQHDLRKISNALDQVKKELEFLEKRTNETNEELKKARKAVYEKDEEMKSLYDRVAGDVASSIKTGKAINLNNPVSKPRIIELYEDLRWNWPKIKSSLRSKGGNENSSKVRELMQKEFYQAKAEMTEKINHIDGVFDLNMERSDTANPKVKEYRQLTI
ncbi:uncharacterized protein LOC122840155 [Gambusia affinis]|uniref:uncharacterized protein LOC122840155 n=1 Tax=Gambusia affinis TaxID=33528 RepID=UPI001CDC36C1|nr:uncharacterized protein LOC122840155 [Gambusia affinis]